MRLVRYTHSCLRVEHDGQVLVIDPGIWSEPRALLGADAVLVTHEHVDHVDVLRLAGLGVPVYAPAEADIAGLDLNQVEAGDTFTAAGFKVTAVGGRHAPVRAGRAGCANLGYLVEDALYHPGDALDVPPGQVHTLLVPMQASWLKTSEAIDFAQAVAPRLALGIHDAQINDRGRASINGWLEEESATDYRWVPPGTALHVDRGVG
ncbi:MAG: MBL fold metallo-hydrolase [Actinomycetota bacterium]|nr:MBL fold metallo-hydrolase [Actinomycetota bacterium]